jgi:uncharacterized protein
MNPFKYGQVVGAKDFCQRPDLMKQVIGFIKAGQNIVLQGERRMGKTSLIHEALNHIKKYSIIYIDLLEIKSVDDIPMENRFSGLLSNNLKIFGQQCSQF